MWTGGEGKEYVGNRMRMYVDGQKERNMWGKRDEDVCGREEKERNMWG